MIEKIKELLRGILFDSNADDTKQIEDLLKNLSSNEDQIVAEPLNVNPKTQQNLFIRIKNSTFVKSSPVQSDKLDTSDKQYVPIQTEVPIKDFYYDNDTDHIKFIDINDDIKYVYNPHVSYVGVNIEDSKKILSSAEIKIQRDTYFKLIDEETDRLNDSQKFFISAGAIIKIIKYEISGDKSVRLHLQDNLTFTKDDGEVKDQKSIFYVDYDDIEQLPTQLIFSSDTWIKNKPVQSSLLTDNDLILVKNGSILFTPFNSEPEITDEDPEYISVQSQLNLKIKGAVWNNFYIYKDHAEFLSHDKFNNPKDEPIEEIPEKDRPQINLPYVGLVYATDPISKGGNFTWAEAVHFNAKNGHYRMPANENVVRNIIRADKHLNEIRAFLGNKPMRINSWYRDPVTNRRCGGASRSRHLEGDAVDFVVKGISPHTVYKLLNPWMGSKGGLASSSVFTHVDFRGWASRWNYGY